MALQYEALTRQALELDLAHRAELAWRLLESLDADREVNPQEAERLWIEVAERRMQAWREGRTSTRPASEVLERARRAAHN